MPRLCEARFPLFLDIQQSFLLLMLLVLLAPALTTTHFWSPGLAGHSFWAGAWWLMGVVGEMVLWSCNRRNRFSGPVRDTILLDGGLHDSLGLIGSCRSVEADKVDAPKVH